MNREETNDYGNLCTQMYELLHPAADEQELEFYLSYARPGQKILEPLCGSGRFLIPFMQRGLDITGVDLSRPMLDKLREKAPDARAVLADLTQYAPEERCDYIFIPASSLGLFTELDTCMAVLKKIRSWLAPGGQFVFSVDTVWARSGEDDAFREAARVTDRDGAELVLKWKNHYDEATQTQFSPSVYQRWQEGVLLEQEQMDFQYHLYRCGEMEALLKQCGFGSIQVYGSWQKAPVPREGAEQLLYACSL